MAWARCHLYEYGRLGGRPRGHRVRDAVKRFVQCGLALGQVRHEHAADVQPSRRRRCIGIPGQQPSSPLPPLQPLGRSSSERHERSAGERPRAGGRPTRGCHRGSPPRTALTHNRQMKRDPHDDFLGVDGDLSTTYENPLALAEDEDLPALGAASPQVLDRLNALEEERDDLAARLLESGEMIGLLFCGSGGWHVCPSRAICDQNRSCRSPVQTRSWPPCAPATSSLLRSTRAMRPT
jgi:hypothetical protein